MELLLVLECWCLLARLDFNVVSLRLDTNRLEKELCIEEPNIDIFIRPSFWSICIASVVVWQVG